MYCYMYIYWPKLSQCGLLSYNTPSKDNVNPDKHTTVCQKVRLIGLITIELAWRLPVYVMVRWIARQEKMNFTAFTHCES